MDDKFDFNARIADLRAQIEAENSKMSAQPASIVPEIMPMDQAMLRQIAEIKSFPPAIKDEDDFEMAAIILRKIKAARAWVAERFDPVIQATDKAHKAALAQKNELDMPLKIQEAAIKNAIGAWSMADKQRRDEDTRKLSQKYSGLPVVAPTQAPKVDGISVSERWAWEVVDLAQVPEAYIIRVANKILIDQIVKSQNGKTSIPGIRVFPTVNVNARK